jgi:hypothetical protein
MENQYILYYCSFRFSLHNSLDVVLQVISSSKSSVTKDQNVRKYLLGIMRRFLVWPMSLTWPTVLLYVVLFRTLDDKNVDNHTNSSSRWKFSRQQFFLVYSKSEYTTRIGQCVRPAVRLHDNSSQLHPIALKMCAQNCLSNISVEFEDENDPARNG